MFCYGGSVDQNVGVIERCNRESRGVLDQAREVAQPGSATVWGTGGRVFESRLPDKRTAYGRSFGLRIRITRVLISLRSNDYYFAMLRSFQPVFFSVFFRPARFPYFFLQIFAYVIFLLYLCSVKGKRKTRCLVRK